MPSRQRTQESNLPTVLNGLRILVVEDFPVNQKLIMLLLQKMGCTTELAVNGKEAVEAVQRRHYDVILMDCQMPVMDGYEATAHIRTLEASSGKRVPIIALTADVVQSDRDRCIAAGMDDYLYKPVKAERVREAIAKVIER